MRDARNSAVGSLRRLAAAAVGLLLTAAFCSAALAADLEVLVTQMDGKPLPGAVVTVHAMAPTASAAAPIQAIMDQIDLAYSPDVLVIPVRSTVSFPNSDKTSHEVYSFSDAHPFKLGLYRGKKYPPEHFDKVGLVTLGCNIHDSMLAYILVTDAPYYGRTAADGTWVQADVAHGKYRIEIWSPRLTEPGQLLEQEVVVTQGYHAVVQIHTDHGLRPAPLEQRPHSWDTY
jgi:plastocyanin